VNDLTAAEVIRRLGLEPHPEEGGHFRETWRSAPEVELPARGPYPTARSAGTCIYYLLTPDTFSELHRLPGDEVFHFYLGDPVEMLNLHPDGSGRVVTLGSGLETLTPQHVVPGGVWQGARLAEGGAWALLGCTMAPGFDYADYESGTAELLRGWPEFGPRIRGLLREAEG
jgi:hypothetical protein